MKLFYCTKCLVMQKHNKKCDTCNNEEMREIIIINGCNNRLTQREPKSENK